MNFSSFRYLSAQGLHNLSRNRMMTLAGIGVLTICLALTGVAALFTMNVNSVVAYLGDQNETVVYIDPDADDATITAMQDSLLAIEGVKSVEYVSKQDVLDEYRGYMEEYADLWDEFEDDNPFKANYVVTIKDSYLSDIENISAQMTYINGVVKVSAPVELTGAFVRIQHVVTYAGYVLIAVLAVVSVVVISNTIRLSVHSRRKEINIMKYVGATDGFIRWPFLVEGVGVGFIAAVIASVIVLAGYAVLVNASGNLSSFWQMIVGDAIIPVSKVWYLILPGFLIAGCLLGGIGSVTSVRKHLDV